MDNNKKDRNKNLENIEQTAADPNGSTTQYNAGGNDSDYDGGHPKGGSSKSKGNNAEEQQEPKESNGKSFNAGGNDTDYDGGHP